MLFEIAVRSPLRKLFTYQSDKPLEKGMRVKVPFGSREVVGFVWNETQEEPKGLKEIIEVYDEAPFFDQKTLRFYERACAYYGISLGELLASSLPKKVRDGKALKEPALKHFVPKLPKLSEKQKAVADELIKLKGFSERLLMGETGSGKTEIYLRLMEKVLKENGQTLFLVPEISLTPQLEDRLSERLGESVSVFHSQMKESKREEAFARARLGHADIFLGARSALFLPFKNLKLMVIDEEHDHSYKQSERGPYNARDLSLLRGQIFQVPVILGSATPSMESYHRSLQKKDPIYELPHFYEKQKPDIEVIDLKKTWKEEERSFITEKLHEAVLNTLENKEQVLLFLNRRGSASQRVCTSCGAMDECKHCSSTLTIHLDSKQGICHWCGYRKPLKKECDECGESAFFIGGIGTKEVEAQIKEHFPEACVARLDRDQTQKRNVLAKTLRDFAEGKIDILVGTQMISKGIDIPNLSLVGVILADQGWSLPDFRATEKAFQLLKQVMGRAGRRGQSSQFIIQTFLPDHSIFEFLKKDDVKKFNDEELKVRETANLPPFSKMSLWTIADKSEKVVQESAQSFVKRIQSFAKSLNITVTSAVPAPLYRWKGVYRMQVLTKAPLKGHMTTFTTTVLDDLGLRPIKAKVRLDRDPYNFV